MNKKILLMSLLAIFMLLAISFASTVTSDIQKPSIKESPLFGIRTRKAIKEKIGDLLRRFIGERVFFLPFQWLNNLDGFFVRQRFAIKEPDTEDDYTCWETTPCCILR